MVFNVITSKNIDEHQLHARRSVIFCERVSESSVQKSIERHDDLHPAQHCLQAALTGSPCKVDI